MNVLLVSHTDENQHLLLPRVLKELERLGGGHRLRLVRDSGRRLKRFPLWQLYSALHRLWAIGRPTVVISMRPPLGRPRQRFSPSWATVWEQIAIDKIQEYTTLEQAGIPVPRWVALRKDTKVDLSAFENYVVVKPADGAKGALVRVIRRDRVRWEDLRLINIMGRGTDTRVAPQTGEGGVSEALIVQQYVHTGPWPTSYRVGTVFGEPIYAWRVTANTTRKPFDDRMTGARFFDGRTIVSSSRGCHFDAEVSDDVLALARRAHRAFSTVPLLAVDMIRHHSSGELYVLEVNASRWILHLTSKIGERLLQEAGINLWAQFGGPAAIARGIHGRLSEYHRELKHT